MSCKRIRKYLPLYVGEDLSPKKKEAVRVHLVSCLDCQKIYKSYVRSIKTSKEWLERERVAWGEVDWMRAFKNALAKKSESGGEFAPWPFKKVWAFSLMGAILILAVFFVTRPIFLGVEDFSKQAIPAKTHPPHQESIVVKAPQDVVSMTMVSKETGLKIVWFLNKNFNLEEDE